jgi:hypothetical protein
MNSPNTFLVILFILGLTLSSCGKGAGAGGSSSSTTTTSPESRNCFNLNGKNTLKEIALESNRARVECGLSEEDIIAQIKR